MLLEVFYDGRTNSCVQDHAKYSTSLRSMDGVYFLLIAVNLDCTKYSEININFCHALKCVTNKICQE